MFRGMKAVEVAYTFVQRICVQSSPGRDRFLLRPEEVRSWHAPAASLDPVWGSRVWRANCPELDTEQRWEAAFLLMFVTMVDLFGGYTFNLALSRRTMDVGPGMHA